MTDKELLTLAAKAVGYRIKREVPDSGLIVWDDQDNCFGWNPLQYDGDALRLAVKLNLHVQIDFDDPDVNEVFVYGPYRVDTTISETGEPYAATRRAIVRAAAEIGKGMK